MFINFFFGTKLKQMDQKCVSREFHPLSMDMNYSILDTIISDISYYGI